MNKNISNKVSELANRPYTVIVVLEESTEGEPVYLAQSPELEGCFGQGKTVSEADENLHAARVDYIHSLLEDGLPVPDPSVTSTSDKFTSTVTLSYHQRDILNVQPTTQSPDSTNQTLRLYEGVIRI